MLNLSYGNHMEALIKPLIKHIEASQRRDPMAPVTVIIPNPSVAQFVRFQVAQHLGVCANLEFHHLRRFLSERVQEANPKVRILEGETLQLLLFRQLYNPEVIQHIALEPVRTYLDIAESPEEREGRSIQLAAQLAALFEEYGYARQFMLSTWRKGELTVKDEVWARTERWQRVLWRSLFDEDGAALIDLSTDAAGVQELAREGLHVPSQTSSSSGERESLARRGKRKERQALFYQEEELPSAQRLKRKLGKGPRWMFLPEAVRATSTKLSLPAQLHVFGLSYVAPAFAEIFSMLSAYSEVHIYAMNPCCEFWEDVDTRVHVAREGWISRAERVEKFSEQEDPFNLEDPDDAPALRLWGRPGREYIRTLNQLTECEFEERFIDPLEREGAATQLKELQRDILYRVPARPPLTTDVPLDGSLRLIACPGVRREVEIIADEIWRQVSEARERGEPLRFHQIAVMVTDRQRQEYLTHIDTIFRERYQLPFNMIDRSLSAQSRVLEGLMRLLELPLGEFSYHQVMGVATHPCVGGVLEGVNLDRWRQWGEQLNVRFGADQEDLEGTYIDRDVYHWDQGLRRLALGVFMEGERAGDERLFEVEGRAWVPFEVGGDGLHDASQMINLCRSLIIDATRCQTARLTLGRWCMLFTRLIKRYLGAKSPADEHALTQCLETVEELKLTDLEGAHLSYKVAVSLLQGRLKRLEARRGQHQADGVVVSSMLPMRAIPFHTIYLLGLGEQDFPAKTPQDPLDLRQAQQRPGDVTPSQRDRYLFLETMLCARERLVLSYVAFDDRTGDPLEPSTVVRELHFISRGYLGPSGLKAEQHPLSAYHLSYDWALSRPINEAEQRVWRDEGTALGLLQRDDQTDHQQTDEHQTDEHQTDENQTGEQADLISAEGWGGQGRIAPPEILKGIRAARLRRSLNLETGAGRARREELEAAIKLWSREQLNRYLGVEAPPPLEPGEGANIRLSLHDLRSFLYDPLQGSAKTMLGLRDEEIKDEEAPLYDPLHFDHNTRFKMLQRAFWEGRGEREAVGRRYDELFERASLVGAAPVGFFAEEQRRRDREVLFRWVQNVQLFQPPPIAHWRKVNIGPGREFEQSHVSLPSLPFTVPLAQGGTAQVELTAQLSPIQPDWGGTMQCVPRGGVGPHLFLTGFLEMVALAAARQPLPPVFTVRLNPFSDNSPSRLTRLYRTPTPDQARGWLSEVIGELTQGLHAYQLPIKAVLRWREQLTRDVHAPFTIKYDERGFGPVPDVERFPTPPPAIALDLVRRRFGPWFESEVYR